MASVTDAPLAALVREADPDTVTGFVAALYEARGYAVEREGTLLELSPGDRTVAVLPSGPPPDTADAVVLPDSDGVATDEDVDVVDVDTLHEQLCYALDSGDARDLLASYFDFVPEETVVDEDDDQESGENDRPLGPVESLSSLGHRLPGRVTVAAVGVAVVLLAGLGVGFGFGSGLTVLGGDSPASAGEATTAVANVSITPTPAREVQANTFEASPPRGEDTEVGPDSAAEHLGEQSYPPGIDAGGITDMHELVAAHRSELSNTSYTVTIRYQEFVDGQSSAVYVERIRVENESRYSVSVTSIGELESTPRMIVGADLFVDGDERHVRVDATEPYIRRRSTPTRFLGQMARYLRWSLSVEESTLRGQQTVGNRTTYRVTTDGDPFQGIENAAGVAFVTEDGRVTYGRWTYLTIRPDVRVEFTIRTTNVGTTTVTRPGWVDDE